MDYQSTPFRGSTPRSPTLVADMQIVNRITTEVIQVVTPIK